MPIIDTISINNLTYQQGIFANNLTRNNIYDYAHRITNHEEISRNESVYNFIYNSLTWGNFDQVVGRYKRTNARTILNNIDNFSDYSHQFITILDTNNPELIFNSFKKGELTIKCIGDSYFTKFMHFYSYGRNQSNKFIIIDKWIKLAWAALVIELNLDHSYQLALSSIKKDNNKYSVAPFNYTKFNQCSTDLRNIADTYQFELSRFEELIFGWDLRVQINSLINPRNVILQILNEHL